MLGEFKGRSNNKMERYEIIRGHTVKLDCNTYQGAFKLEQI